MSLSDEFQVAKVHPSRGYRGKQVMSRTCPVRYSDLSARNLVPRVRVALSSGTGPVADQKDRGLWERDWFAR